MEFPLNPDFMKSRRYTHNSEGSAAAAAERRERSAAAWSRQIPGEHARVPFAGRGDGFSRIEPGYHGITDRGNVGRFGLQATLTQCLVSRFRVSRSKPIAVHECS
eukprot:1282929-Prymnesium_polylepis.1